MNETYFTSKDKIASINLKLSSKMGLGEVSANYLPKMNQKGYCP